MKGETAEGIVFPGMIPGTQQNMLWTVTKVERYQSVIFSNMIRLCHERAQVLFMAFFLEK